MKRVTHTSGPDNRTIMARVRSPQSAIAKHHSGLNFQWFSSTVIKIENLDLTRKCRRARIWLNNGWLAPVATERQVVRWATGELEPCYFSTAPDCRFPLGKTGHAPKRTINGSIFGSSLNFQWFSITKIKIENLDLTLFPPAAQLSPCGRRTLPDLVCTFPRGRCASHHALHNALCPEFDSLPRIVARRRCPTVLRQKGQPTAEWLCSIPSSFPRSLNDHTQMPYAKIVFRKHLGSQLACKSPSARHRALRRIADPAGPWIPEMGAPGVVTEPGRVMAAALRDVREVFGQRQDNRHFEEPGRLRVDDGLAARSEEHGGLFH
jgi:hypothetical protein